eukprot:TRINITY_DN2130_c0_g1_i2.p1 TRINITY_DN2130_c0_g1~~TRINITY_DN2130_c0_g1_i2.p1  ORF type:complete len:233 (-),score=29.90 TRINITY_DN2130_c0_g1_i2:743-1441(-)
MVIVCMRSGLLFKVGKAGIRIRAQINNQNDVPPPKTIRIVQKPDQNSKNSINRQNGLSSSSLKNIKRTDVQSERSLFICRMATLILGAVLIGERLTGRGVVAAFELGKTGVALYEAEAIPIIIAAALMYFGLTPIFKQFTPQRSVQLSVDYSKWKNLQPVLQLFFGRLACLGLSVAIIAEIITGKGALALFNVETGVEELTEVEAIIAFLLLLVLTDVSNENYQTFSGKRRS